MTFSKSSVLVFSFLIFNVFLCGYAAQDANNSSRNKEHVENNDLTSKDQSNAKHDIEVTRKIRQKVVAEDSFSTTAKNVKIITIGGGVTLKGPVQTMAEKDRIAEIARSIAGKSQVIDELEVVKE